jgi:glycosyltransferase involved in cell wall biosynthesis
MVLFITRKHPPSIGGMQKLSQSLTVEVGKLAPTTTISWGHGTIFLPFFLCYALLRALVTIPFNRRIQVVHLSDALLAPLGLLLKTLYHVPVVVTVHGLDITFDNAFYQWIVPRCLRHMDRLICVSSYTRDQCLRRGVPADLCDVIPNGVNMSEFTCNFSEDGDATVRALAGRRLEGRKALLTVGRLIERKGVVHFLDAILPRVLAACPDTCYLIVGEGPLREVIETRIASLHLEDHVVLLGQVDDAALKAAYHLAALFVMPNVPVPNDIEGFGLVALEAGAAERYVVASRLDGIPEAVVASENGDLVDPGDTRAFADAVIRLLGDDALRAERGRRAREFVRRHYSWDIIAGRYNAIFREVVRSAVERGDLPRRRRGSH